MESILASCVLIAQIWRILPGQKIFDIGCEQDIDIARPEYGRPCTAKESHGYAMKSELRSPLTFLRSDTPSFLRDLHRPVREIFDSVALFHNRWYFAKSQSVYDLFQTTADDAQTPRVYLCEYSYETSLDE
ncbi:hypothetical protein ABOM_005760 [Aspergillus bombycis]|uniref:Uncharacterized protein n=1 Tax=Aspergillus bombycis TaxID=109264 RepID=A0A1F8A0R9_9EURO|nr:hypothetical protein ABOM_005760 [Aspergillus bombycis]OGM45029.1 hypothetical protein ABOM_005760 [Aspergillus bombycis]